VKYTFIKANKDNWPVRLQCKVFDVSRSGYHQWVRRSPSARKEANDVLDTKIEKIFGNHKSRYGAPRITKELNADGDLGNEKRVATRMKSLDLKAKQAQRFKATTDSNHKIQ